MEQQPWCWHLSSEGKYSQVRLPGWFIAGMKVDAAPHDELECRYHRTGAERHKRCATEPQTRAAPPQLQPSPGFIYFL